MAPRRGGFNAIELVLISSALAVPLAIAAYTYHERLTRLTAATFESPLPAVSLGNTVAPPNPYRQPYTFSQDWFTGHIPIWRKALVSYVGQPDVQYLEVGIFEGRSALWMLENVLTHPTSRLVGVDVFEGPLRAQYLANLALSGAQDRAKTIVEPSQIALRRLPLESFDVIYIDGSHAEDDVLEDAVLSFRLLKPGGVLIFDDYRWARAIFTASPDDQTDFAKASIERLWQQLASMIAAIDGKSVFAT